MGKRDIKKRILTIKSKNIKRMMLLIKIKLIGLNTKEMRPFIFFNITKIMIKDFYKKNKIMRISL
jgi:hypothetical protein